MTLNTLGIHAPHLEVQSCNLKLTLRKEFSKTKPKALVVMHTSDSSA